MKTQILIKNGRIFDPAMGIDEVRDIAIAEGKIQPFDYNPYNVKEVVDAAGCVVMPGLIDTHSHIFTKGSQLGTPGDATMFPMGVTTTIDMGSSGYVNYDDFVNEVQNETIESYYFVNVTPYGPVSLRESETADPKLIDGEALSRCVKNDEKCLGLKIRMGEETIRDFGIEPLLKTVEIAEGIGCKVAVHVSNSTVPLEEMAKCLRSGDVYCHVYQDRKETIIDQNGRIKPEIIKAKERGVIFDVAHGLKNAANSVAVKSLMNGFSPDFIGTDSSSIVAYRSNVIGQPFIMSKFMALGLSLEEVTEMVTSKPAEWLGETGRIGTLKPGADGNIAIMKIQNRKVSFNDYHDEPIEGKFLLVPQMTIFRGKPVYRSVEFSV